jgi:hypothetical protein
MNDSHKLVAGALLAGASLLTGNAALITAAGGIGVNWSSEALAGLLDARELAANAGEPLAAAYRKAIEQAVDDLRPEYRKLDGRNQKLLAFDLVKSCGNSVATVQLPPRLEAASVEQALASALDQLLLGHDEREVAYLKKHLLGAAARRFRTVLAADDQAWRRYHGWLIEQMATAVARPAPGSLHPAAAAAGAEAPAGPSRTELIKALAAIEDTTAALAQLMASAERLEELIRRWDEIAAEQPPTESLTFNNQALQAGTVIQGKEVDYQSANASSGGSATVYNISGAVVTPELLAALLRPAPEPKAQAAPPTQSVAQGVSTTGDPAGNPPGAPDGSALLANLPHKMTGPQMHDLHAALLSACTPESLRQALAFHLNRRLIDIAGGSDFSAVVFNVLEWAQREGQLPRLLQAVHRQAPENPQLNAVLRSLGAA